MDIRHVHNLCVVHMTSTNMTVLHDYFKVVTLIML